MQNAEHYTWAGDIVHQAEPRSHVATLRKDRQAGSLVVTLGNIDLPAFVSEGVLYIQAPLPLVFEAFAEDVSAFLRDVEVRVSTAGGSPLPLDSNGRPLSSTRMAQSRVVRSRRQQ